MHAEAAWPAAPPEPKEGFTPVQPLHVRLNLASKGDHASLQEAATASYALPSRDSPPK